ncbi:MAG: hypothetical protein ACK4KW_00495 [Gemmobacter sp.]
MHRVTAFVLLAMVAATPATAQDRDQRSFHRDLAAQIEFYLTKRPERHFQVEVPPDAAVLIPDELKTDLRFGFQKRMALSGHGVLFDIEGRRVELNFPEVLELQAELLEAARAGRPDGDLPREADERLQALIKEVEAGELLQKLEPVEAAALRHLLIEAYAFRLGDARRSAILWRAQFLLDNYILVAKPFKALRDDILLVHKRLRDILIAFWNTPYMNDCVNAGVPVPPDFSISGSAWTSQGTLTQNLLSPGQFAEVWTWASPHRRGACVALPRRNAAGTAQLAGIICQGAGTGNACFWDNIDRNTGQRLPWDVNVLRIRELQDGSNLNENCTTCHKGNNVYLIAPDDATWCRLLRGGKPGVGCAAPGGSNAANLTLQVEVVVNPVTQPNSSVVHTRYTPLSGTPPRPGWVNNEGVGCGGLCHLGGAAVTPPSPMPPACGTSCY